MTDNKHTGNPIFDIWMANQEQFLQAQQAWMKPPQPPANPFMNVDFLDRSMKSWQQCEDQYNHWMKAAENWTGAAKLKPAGDDVSAQALNYLINPVTFMQSGFEMMDSVFRKLVNGPEFADIGTMEKKMLKSGQDWQNFRDAGHRYQEVIAAAWLRAYQHFSDELFDRPGNEQPSPEQSLQRWLKIADEEMVATMRSKDFLEAQREFFAAGTAYRLKFREFVEMWCESNSIPTRTEIDDLHKIIHDLRKEVKALRKQAHQHPASETKTPAKSKARAKKAKAKSKRRSA